MNTTKLLIIFLTVILITLAGLLLVLSGRQDKGDNEPIPVFTPTNPSPTSTQILNREEQILAEQNYAKEREKILKEKPWLLKMPLRTEDYWINYSTERDVFDILIYFSPKFPKDEQITSKKQRIAKDLSAIGVDVNKVKINYTEKEI